MTDHPEYTYFCRLPVQQSGTTSRFSLGFHTTDEDVAQAVGLIEEVLAKLPNAELACST